MYSPLYQKVLNVSCLGQHRWVECLVTRTTVTFKVIEMVSMKTEVCCTSGALNSALHSSTVH